MKLKTGFGAWLIYVAVRAVLAIMQAFPVEWNLRTARILSRLWIWFLPRHRRRAIEHLRTAFPSQKSEHELGELAERCLESVTMFAVEVICLPRAINAHTWSSYIHLRNFNEVLRVLAAGKGAILVTGHYGSFEVIGHLLAVIGFDIVSVMRPLDNVFLNRFLVRTRRTHGLTLIDKKGAMQQAEGILQRGGLLGFIGDQDAGRKGLFVDFFNQPASTYKSIGLLAMASGAPIIVGYTRRLGRRARYEVGVQRIIRREEWAERDDPLRWITQAYTSAIEGFVQEEPSQYLWIHRRWKSKPRRHDPVAPHESEAASGSKSPSLESAR